MAQYICDSFVKTSNDKKPFIGIVLMWITEMWLLRCIWWKCWCICGDCSKACLSFSRCDWVREWASAGNLQLYQCIRKPIGLHSGVPTQLKSNIGRWKRGQCHFSSQEIGLRLLQALTLLKQVCLWLTQSPLCSRRMRQTSSISTLHLQSIQCSNIAEYAGQEFSGLFINDQGGICHDFSPDP